MLDTNIFALAFINDNFWYCFDLIISIVELDTAYFTVFTEQFKESI